MRLDTSAARNWRAFFDACFTGAEQSMAARRAANSIAPAVVAGLLLLSARNAMAQPTGPLPVDVMSEPVVRPSSVTVAPPSVSLPLTAMPETVSPMPPAGIAVELVSPSGRSLEITWEAAGPSLRLVVGDRFTIKLAAGYVWTVRVSDETIVAPVPAALEQFEALLAGQTSIAITGDPVCHAGRRGCLAPSVGFDLQVLVDPLTP